MKARSSAIAMAVKKYNSAAAAVNPPRPPIKADDVLSYVYLSEFDLLRDSRFNVLTKPWARAAEREAINNYFRLCRSKEEIERLNLEITHLVTYIRDSEDEMKFQIEHFEQSDKKIAYQLKKRLRRRSIQNDVHRMRLRQIQALHGFSGTLVPGFALTTIRANEHDAMDGTIDEPSTDAIQLSDDEDSQVDETEQALDDTIRLFDSMGRFE